MADTCLGSSELERCVEAAVAAAVAAAPVVSVATARPDGHLQFRPDRFAFRSED